MCVSCVQNGVAIADSIGLEPQTTKVLSIATAAVMLFSLAVPMATPATKVKAGAVCTKANVKIVKSGNTFVCKKSGKKLIWKIQVKKSAATIASPDATPITTPTAAIERKDWELVYLKIWDEFNNSQNQGSFPFEYKLSPNVNQAKATESIAAYDKAMKLWLAVLDGAKVSPVVWSIMSEKDYTWWKQVVEEIEGNSAPSVWNPITNNLGHCQLSSIAFCGYGITYKANTPEYKFLQYNVIGSGYTRSPNSNTVNHEAVHFYQFSVVQRFPGDLPCWYIEGQASLYGGALEFNLTGQRADSIRQRDNFKQIVRQYQPSANSFTAKDWVDVLTKMYPPHISCSSQQDYFKYALGMFVWEYLYDQFGSKVMHQFLLDFKAGRSFADSSQRQLNLAVHQLNEKLAIHLVHVFAGVN